MVYITGDIHGAPHRIVNFAKDIRISRNDTLIILGDVGANYYLNEVDSECKRLLNSLKCTVFCRPLWLAADLQAGWPQGSSAKN